MSSSSDLVAEWLTQLLLCVVQCLKQKGPRLIRGQVDGVQSASSLLCRFPLLKGDIVQCTSTTTLHNFPSSLGLVIQQH